MNFFRDFVRRLRARRAGRQVERLAHAPILGSPADGRNRIPYAVGVIPAKTGAGGVSARSGSTPGSGTVTLRSFDRDAGTLSDWRTETVYNQAATAVGGTKDILVAYGQGVLWVIVESC